MTDITELAPAMKAAAIDAKELAIIARYSKGRAAAEKFYALANPNNVIALVEALEKAQETIAFQQGEIKALLSSLESRTVTVKLAEDKPAESESEVDDAEAWFDEGWNARGEADRDALAAAGIKVEAE